MTGPEPTVGCQVSLLFPHPRRVAVLVAEAGASSGTSTPPTLPTLSMSGDEPPLSEILASVDVVGTADRIPPVLRLVLTSPPGATDAAGLATDEVSLMVEFDDMDSAPAGWAWVDLDPEVIARLEPPTVRAAVAAWAGERVDGWSPLRPPWSRPGWFATASAWMVEHMAAAGRPALDTPRIHQLWGLSVVLVAPSPDGNMFLKCSADLFRHEALATQSLAARTPERVPDVVAVDDARGWLLMRDFGAGDLGDQDQSLWHQGLVAHARIQQAWLGRTDEIGPGPTLVHGDLHPWNVAHGPTATRVFDWTDAAVSHPFIDLATYVSRTDDQVVRRRLVDAYVDAWSTVTSEHTLREAVALGLVVGALCQVQTYRTLLPALMGNGADDGLAGLDLNWLERSLTYHAQGRESPD